MRTVTACPFRTSAFANALIPKVSGQKYWLTIRSLKEPPLRPFRVQQAGYES